jgi:hypothetical protein
LKACWFLLVLNFPGLFITVSQEEEIIRILKAEKTDTEVEAGSNGVRVIPGTRRIEDNLSDLRAQVAANQRGIVLIGELIEQYGLEVVQAYMVHVQVHSSLPHVCDFVTTASGLNPKPSRHPFTKDWVKIGIILVLSRFYCFENKG